MLCNKNQNENGIVAMSYSVELAYTKRSYRRTMIILYFLDDRRKTTFPWLAFSPGFILVDLSGRSCLLFLVQ